MKTKTTFRPDIQGLRAVAVISVLIYHLNTSWLPGGFVGVDVFFVISGYLITGLLIKSLESQGRISVSDFYARRAKRLLPAATIVLVATPLAAYLVLPEGRWASIGWDTVASSFYVENWRLAASSIDYLQLDQAASPLQHFWSLGVEEQFYFVWPFLLIGAGLLFTRGRRAGSGITSNRFRLVCITVLLVVALPSFAWSIHYTSVAPGPAYFVTTTRVWELAIGAILAAGAPLLARLPTTWLLSIGWVGAAGIIASLAFIGPSVPYPGVAALLPTVASACVICAGINHSSRSSGLAVAKLLSIKPAVWVGDISYSLYLWHWPVITIAIFLLGPMTGATAFAVAASSLLLAWASYRFVETPINESSYLKGNSSKAIALGVTLTITSATAGSLLVIADRSNQAAAMAQFVNDYQSETTMSAQAAPEGAMTLPNPPRGATIEVASNRIDPLPLTAAQDRPDCATTAVDGSDVSSCTFGVASGKKVALVGDSHAQQWIPALSSIASKQGWSVTAYLHDACPFATGALVRDSKPYQSCIDWNVKILAQLTSDQDVKMVVTSNYTDSVNVSDRPGVDGMAAAFARSWQAIEDSGRPLVALRDTPAPGINVPECVSQNESDLTKCAVPRAEAFDDRGLAQIQAVGRVAGSNMIDLNDYICPADSCAAVIGSVLVYRDNNHLTATYAATLSTALSEKLVPLMPNS